METGPLRFSRSHECLGRRKGTDARSADKPDETADLVERLMGKKPELRFQYVQENARFVEELDVQRALTLLQLGC
jgi:hypothetical protein